MKEDVILDCKGLFCPMPIIKIKKTLSSMNSGKVLRIEATCESSKYSIFDFISRTGDELLETKEENGTFIFLLRKK